MLFIYLFKLVLASYNSSQVTHITCKYTLLLRFDWFPFRKWIQVSLCSER